MSGEPELGDAIAALVDSRLAGVHVALPGQIEKYDRATHKAEVKPLLKKRYTDGTSAELPVIVNVPVVWPRTSEFELSAPLARGDGVLLVFAERSLDAWLAKGGVIAPPDGRKFDLSDAIAIPGLYSFKADALTGDDDGFSLRYKDASIVIGDDGTVDINDGNFTVET
jgi:hypothetical protein